MLWVKVKLFEILKKHSSLLTKELQNDEHLALMIETVINNLSEKIDLKISEPHHINAKYDFALLTGAHLVIHFNRFFKKCSENTKYSRRIFSLLSDNKHLIDESLLISILSTALIVAAKYSEDLSVHIGDFSMPIWIKDHCYFLSNILLLKNEMFYLKLLEHELHASYEEILSLILKESDSLDGKISLIQKKSLHSRVCFFRNNTSSENYIPSSTFSFRFKQDLITSSVTLFEPKKLPRLLTFSPLVNSLLDKPINFTTQKRKQTCAI